MTRHTPHSDSDARKGATESGVPEAEALGLYTRPDIHGNLSDQLPHRNTDPQIYDYIGENDTDFPEPGSNPEHTGQKYS
jgi:hypothetical protein